MALSEVMASPDKGIPQDLMDKAQCVVIVPGLKKGAFGVGGKYGRGFTSCRKCAHGWSAPAAVAIEGGSFGLQLGASSTDVIMLVMKESGMNRLLGDKFTIGGQADAAAGPVGRETSANTDVLLRAEILSWSRSRGLLRAYLSKVLRCDRILRKTGNSMDAISRTKRSWNQASRPLPLLVDLSRLWTVPLVRSWPRIAFRWEKMPFISQLVSSPFRQGLNKYCRKLPLS